MGTRFAQISLIFITLGVSSCFQPPEFPVDPVIAYKSLHFGSDPDNRRDSLLLTFSIEDGDGNVGLEEDELYAPYHPFNLIIDSRDSVVTLSMDDAVPPFYSIDPTGAVELFSEVDDRPPYDCKSYTVANFEDIGSDTFYIQRNEFHNNIYIDFLKKQNGEYNVIDIGEELEIEDCGLEDFDGRIPIFDRDNLGRSLSGTISYSMATGLTGAYQFLLQRDTFRLRFYVIDRSLTRSNIVETPDLTLPDITQ